jgi:prepilin-type N-terminal cleavage/methylation domain-containing protein
VTGWIRQRLTQRGEDRQAGFTLAETVVTMFVLGIVLAGVQTALIMTQRVVGNQSIRVDQTQQSGTAIAAMSKTLRTAVLPSQLGGTCGTCNLAAFIQGTPNSVQFYANINNDGNTVGPSRVTYSVNSSNQLVETIQAPNAHAATDFNYQYCTPGPGCVVPTRVIAQHVVPGTQLFTYYDKSGNDMTAGNLSATELNQVDSIDLLVKVQDTTSSTVPPTTFVARITLPNAQAITDSTASPSP